MAEDKRQERPMPKFGNVLDPDLAWVAKVKEPAREPGLPIVDPHHHLWERPSNRYLLPDLLADCNEGHNVVGTVFVECGAMFRADGPEPMKAVGEVEFVNGTAAMSASGQYGKTKACNGIVGHAELRIGAKVRGAGGADAGRRPALLGDPLLDLLGRRHAGSPRPDGAGAPADVRQDLA